MLFYSLYFSTLFDFLQYIILIIKILKLFQNSSSGQRKLKKNKQAVFSIQNKNYIQGKEMPKN